MQLSPIEWTQYTANPLRYRDADGNIVHACIHASTGCLHCYAETLAPRWGRHGKKFTVENMKSLTPFLDEKELHQMLTLKQASGKMCFIGDMTDIFGDWVPFELLDKLFAVFALRWDVTWQVLTKRAQRAMEYWNDPDRAFKIACQMLTFAKPPMPIPDRIPPHLTPTLPLRNVWLGVSVENQQYKSRIDILREIPAAVRFLSVEPLLEDVGVLDLRAIHQVIMGGESGPGARLFDIQWARSVVQQCKAAGVACFVKQLGSNPFVQLNEELEAAAIYLKSRKGGAMEEWPSDLQVRELPK